MIPPGAWLYQKNIFYMCAILRNILMNIDHRNKIINFPTHFFQMSFTNDLQIYKNNYKYIHEKQFEIQSGVRPNRNAISKANPVVIATVWLHLRPD